MEYKSKSQLARIRTEEWTLNNLFCPFCGHPFVASATNTKVYDFTCPICDQQYQLKAVSKKIGKKLVGSEYYTFIKAIENNCVPNFIIMEYSLNNTFVIPQEIFFIPKVFITKETIEKRKPLSETARRAGWTGYNLLFDRIPSYGKLLMANDYGMISKEKILNETRKISSLYNIDSQKVKWKIEILKIIDQLDNEFKLQDVYQYLNKLEILFPDNNHVKDKIRQQLQFIRDDGIIVFLGDGKYEKT